MSWDGRTLTSQTLSNGTVLSYAYNSSGIRTQKTYGSSYRKDYLLDGTTIVAEIKTNLSNNSKETIYYFYDETGVAGFEYNGAKYHYVKNLQGDIISIQNANGIVVVNYAYDAWGNVLSISGTSAVIIGTLNPFRYRGYYYDTETGYYYLNSRYYDPVVGRFLNGDSSLYTGQGLFGCNTFVYCNNNPVIYVDNEGEFPVLAGIGVIVVIGLTVATMSSCTSDSNQDMAGTLMDMAPKTTRYETLKEAIDEAFLKLENKYNTQDATNYEHACFVYEVNGGYYVSQTYHSKKYGCVIYNPSIVADGIIHAYIHTHPHDTLEIFSSDDWVICDREGVDFYVSLVGRKVFHEHSRYVMRYGASSCDDYNEYYIGYNNDIPLVKLDFIGKLFDLNMVGGKRNEIKIY